jgi:FHA domain
MTPRDPRAAPDPTLSVAAGRDLVALVGRLVRDRSWDTLTALFASLGGEEGLPSAALGDLDAAVRIVGDALGVLAAPKNPRGAQADELRALSLAAADALLDRCARPPLTDLERRALERAAGLLERAGDHRRAALAYEDLGADDRAALAWGALGDLDRMEAAHAREERRLAIARAAGETLRRFEALLTGGERLRAVIAAAAVSGIGEAAGLRERAAGIERRLCRGHAVSLRVPGGAGLRVAPLPADIGRDREAGVALRDPAVSRRHALLRMGADAVLVEDCGSRGGVRLGGARLDPGVAIALRGDGEIAVGPTTAIAYHAEGTSLMLEVARGLDRGARVLVGAAPVALGAALPAADGLTIQMLHDVVRLERSPELAVRVDGHFIGPACDLLHGDVIEIPSRGARLEVE